MVRTEKVTELDVEMLHSVSNRDKNVNRSCVRMKKSSVRLLREKSKIPQVSRRDHVNKTLNDSKLSKPAVRATRFSFLQLRQDVRQKITFRDLQGENLRRRQGQRRRCDPTREHPRQSHPSAVTAVREHLPDELIPHGSQALPLLRCRLPEKLQASTSHSQEDRGRSSSHRDPLSRNRCRCQLGQDGLEH